MNDLVGYRKGDVMEAKNVKINIIRPSVEIMSMTNNAARLIEQAGRTCYKSEGLIDDGSASAFIKKILGSGHHSVIEHAVATIRFICDRGISHELVRHRLASFSQESTRYCNYAGNKFGGELTFIKPCFWGVSHPQYDLWFGAMQNAARIYTTMIEAGARPEQARSVLPNSLKTEVVMTANLREWLHVLHLRLASAAHPQIREIMLMALGRLYMCEPAVFGHLREMYPQTEEPEGLECNNLVIE